MANIEKRETQDGKTSYRVKVRLKGYPVQSATFDRLTDAKKWVQHTEAAIREGRHFKTAEARRHTLGELIDRYTRDVLPKKPKQIRVQTAHFAWWKEQLGAYALADITPALWAECRDKLSHGRANATVVRHMAALSSAFSIAVKEWGWLEDSPMRKVEKPTLPRGRVRFLSDDERARLLAACKESTSPILYTVVVLALSTGMRQGEVMGLTWDDVDLPRGRAILHETKNGDRRAEMGYTPTSPLCRKNNRMSSASERACVLSITLLRCFSTVLSLSPSSKAMTLLACPSIILSITSCSRGDNPMSSCTNFACSTSQQPQSLVRRQRKLDTLQ